jgi:hypothetical protein
VLQEKNKEKKVVPGRKDDEKMKKKLTVMDTQSDDISRVGRASKIIERMVNQNTYDDVAQGKHYSYTFRKVFRRLKWQLSLSLELKSEWKGN